MCCSLMIVAFPPALMARSLMSLRVGGAFQVLEFSLLHKSETESLFGFWETCLFLSRRLATLETDMLYELRVGAQKKAVRRNW
jgi:hypothetical protein